MTFAHLADLQLGCNRFDGRLSRAREQDFYDAWLDMADRLARQQDLTHVVIAGDIFEYPTPSTAARYAFQLGLRTLTAVGKKVLVVSGNHETPRSAETMHALIPYHSPADGVWVCTDEAMTVEGFRLVPWVWGEPISEEDLDSNAAVLVLHAPTPVIEAYRNAGDRDYLPEMGEGYRYVALGDYHVPSQVGDNAWYPGSLEHTSFGEAEAECGALIVTLDNHGNMTRDFEPSKMRRMKNIHIKKDHEEELAGVVALIGNAFETMYRIVFHGIEPTQINPLLLSAAKDSGRFVKIVFQDRPEPPPMVDFGPQTLLDQWATFVENAEYGPEVAEVGADILEEAIG